MRSRKQVTIRDVAREAGVSAQTVSRVLNQHPDVSDETRKRVQDTIDRLGYSPNYVARSLIQGRTHTIGVVGYGLGYYGPSRALTGVEKQANELGYSILLSLVRQAEINSGRQLLANLLMRKVDGIVWAVPEIGPHREELLEDLAQIDVPVVFINMNPRPGCQVAAVDNFNGGRLATLHLLSRGCQKIGIITGPEAWWESQQREAGWKTACLESGKVKESEISALKVVGDWEAASGEAGFMTLIQKVPDLDGVFVCNDQMALGALKAARQLGIRVPEDIALVGFDDIPEAAFFNPPLTTLRQPLTELGAQAVRMLHHRLCNEEHDVHASEIIWLQPELIVRESSRKSN